MSCCVVGLFVQSFGCLLVCWFARVFFAGRALHVTCCELRVVRCACCVFVVLFAFTLSCLLLALVMVFLEVGLDYGFVGLMLLT